MRPPFVRDLCRRGNPSLMLVALGTSTERRERLGIAVPGLLAEAATLLQS